MLCLCVMIQRCFTCQIQCVSGVSLSFLSLVFECTLINFYCIPVKEKVITAELTTTTVEDNDTAVETAWENVWTNECPSHFESSSCSPRNVIGIFTNINIGDAWASLEARTIHWWRRILDLVAPNRHRKSESFIIEDSLFAFATTPIGEIVQYYII